MHKRAVSGVVRAWCDGATSNRSGKRRKISGSPMTPAKRRSAAIRSTQWQQAPGARSRNLVMAGPVEDIKVVELGVWVAGPAAGGILADWGADVIKIEPPDGDPARLFGRMIGIEDGLNPPFEMDNRGKRSIVLDLATDGGCATTHELLDGADV